MNWFSVATVVYCVAAAGVFVAIGVWSFVDDVRNGR